MKCEKDKETIPFTIASDRIKYLEISQPKEAQIVYSEICKMLMKETEDHTNRWNDISVLVLEESILLK